MRLRNRREFARVFESSCRSRDGLLTVLARWNQSDQPRLGLAIAKKQVRSAARRNHIKRIVRERFRIWQASLRGLDVVVLAGSNLATASDSSLARSLDQHWHTVQARCKPS